MRFALLAELPQHIGTVAEWLFNEWGDSSQGQSSAKLASRLSERMSLSELPMHILALCEESPVGFAAIKLNEMDEYPDRRHWLGSLYVLHERRQQGIGSALVEEVIRRSEFYNIDCLSLQTEHVTGGLYGRFGWTEVEKITSEGDEILVMERLAEPKMGEQDVPPKSDRAGG